MPALSPGRAKQSELVPRLNGHSSRGRSLRILFAHNDAADVKRCVRELSAANFNVSADIVPSSEQFAERLSSRAYDIVLAEHPSPKWQGTPALELLRQMDIPVPLIFMTGQLPLETVAELITSGAVDCIEMEHVSHLPVTVRRTLSENNLRAERDSAEKHLRHSEANYRALVGNLTYGICRCGADGKFLDVNQTLVTMLGYGSREELLEVNLASDIVSDPRKRAQLLGHCGGELRVDPIEIDWLRRDGLDSEIKRSGRTRREFGLLLFVLDGLKEINDRYGILTGSQAICRLAED